jgi:hypothetical protein
MRWRFATILPPGTASTRAKQHRQRRDGGGAERRQQRDRLHHPPYAKATGAVSDTIASVSHGPTETGMAASEVLAA